MWDPKQVIANLDIGVVTGVRALLGSHEVVADDGLTDDDSKS